MVPTFSSFATIDYRGHFIKMLTGFPSLGTFLGTAPTFLPTWVRLPDAEFNAESICTKFKSQKLKSKQRVCLFLIALFPFEFNQIKVFSYFQAISDSWEISSKSVWSRKIGWFRQKTFFCWSTSFQRDLPFTYRQNLD